MFSIIYGVMLTSVIIIRLAVTLDKEGVKTVNFYDLHKQGESQARMACTSIECRATICSYTVYTVASI